MTKVRVSKEELEKHIPKKIIYNEGMSHFDLPDFIELEAETVDTCDCEGVGSCTYCRPKVAKPLARRLE